MAKAGFDRLRGQFEQRRNAHFQDLARDMAEVDVSVLTETGSAGKHVDPDFKLCGALPPTTSCRCGDVRDVAAIVAVGRSEKQAAQELIARNRQAHSMERKSLKAHVTARSSESDGSAMTSCMQGIGKDILRESEVCDFHRQAEFNRDAALMAFNKATQEAKSQAHLEHVKQITFERKHKQREAAIANMAVLQRKRNNFDDYKLKVGLQLEANQMRKHAEVEQARQQVQERKQKTQARQQATKAYREFTLRQGMIEKTCRQIDTSNINAKRTEHKLQNARLQQQAWAMRSNQLEGRKLLCEAEKKKRDDDDEQRIQYLLHNQEVEQERKVRELQQRNRAQRAFDTFIKDAREEVIAKDADAQPVQALKEYQRTLVAFHDLAKGMKKHGEALSAAGTRTNTIENGLEQMLDTRNKMMTALAVEFEDDSPAVQPLASIEPRIREAFAAAHFSADLSGSAEFSVAGLKDVSSADAPALEESFRIFEEEDEEPIEASHFSGTSAGRLPELPTLPAMAPPFPLQNAVAPIVHPRTVGAPMLTARPLRPPAPPAGAEGSESGSATARGGRSNQSESLTAVMGGRANRTNTMESLNSLMGIKPRAIN